MRMVERALRKLAGGGCESGRQGVEDVNESKNEERERDRRSQSENNHKESNEEK